MPWGIGLLVLAITHLICPGNSQADPPPNDECHAHSTLLILMESMYSSF